MGIRKTKAPNVPVLGFVDFLLYFHHRSIANKLYKISIQMDQADKSILEVGAGRKPNDKYFKNASYVCTDAVDCGGIRQLADINLLPYKDGCFDLVICNNVLEHIPTPDKALGEVFRCLKPGGRLFLVVPFLFPLHDIPYDYFRYTEYSLMNLLKEWQEVDIKKICWFSGKLLFSYAERFVLYYVVTASKPYAVEADKN